MTSSESTHAMTEPDRPHPRAHARRTARDIAARVLTEALAPWVIVLLLPLAVAWQATHSALAMLGWGLLVALTSSILPMAVIVWGARAGRWQGHHVTNREGRLIPFIALIVLSSVGLTLLVLGHAPWRVIALDIAMLGTLIVTAAITATWKISMHTAVSAGAVTILAATYGPVLWVLSPLVGGIAWSRVHIRDHTAAQVTGGIIAGVLAGGGLYAALI